MGMPQARVDWWHGGGDGEGGVGGARTADVNEYREGCVRMDGQLGGQQEGTRGGGRGGGVVVAGGGGRHGVRVHLGLLELQGKRFSLLLFSLQLRFPLPYHFLLLLFYFRLLLP